MILVIETVFYVVVCSLWLQGNLNTALPQAASIMAWPLLLVSLEHRKSTDASEPRGVRGLRRHAEPPHVADAVIAAPQANELAVPMDVQIDVTQPAETDKSVMAFVTLHNRSASAPIANVSVRVGAANISQLEKKLDTLEAGQSWAEKFDVPTTGSNLYLFISYKWNNQEHSLARAIPRPVMSKHDSTWPTLLPVISSLVGAIIGAWLVNFFTSRRERARAKFEWGKMLFERYEKSYRDFLRGLGDLPIPAVLQRQFDMLQDTSLVPSTIRNTYDKTYKILSDSTASAAQKQEAYIMLRQIVESFMKEPWSNSVEK